MFTAAAQIEPSETAKVRSRVNELGVGARVETKLRDTTKIKGRIIAVEADRFSVIDEKASVDRTLRYDEVAEVKKSGGGLSAKHWIIIGSAVAGAAVTWAIVKPAICDGGAQTRGPC